MKKFYVVLIVVIIFIAVMKAGGAYKIITNVQGAQKTFEKGTEYAIKGEVDDAITEFDKAITEFDKIIEANPKMPGLSGFFNARIQVYNARALAYYQKGDYDRSWEDINKIKELGGEPNGRIIKTLEKVSDR